MLTSSPASSTCALTDELEDVVERVVDATTIRFQKSGTVRLAGVRSPDRLPECFSRAPESRTRLLLPRETRCRVRIVSRDGKSPRVEIFRPVTATTTLNERLVFEGYLLASRGSRFADAETAARRSAAGIWTNCSSSVVDTVFEEIDNLPPPQPLQNPGDIKNCADFNTYEESKRYYDLYFESFGDVAKLDRDYDGVPCPGLPHTKNPALFQLKRPRPNIDRD